MSAAPSTRRKRRQAPTIPAALRHDVTQFARGVARKYRKLFAADLQLKHRLLRLSKALLPPQPRRRGRPRNPVVTRAITAYAKLHRQFPDEQPRAVWARVYPIAIPGYESMSDLDQRSAREELHQRVTWRRRKRRPRKIPARIPVS